ncbi:Uncharacterized protein dnm_080500 [Desulfonema magnum]|uniref:Uncharacterized protein n=1 Tax=Desulfonema magnum TaxID=45655 RepID=A0A975GSJ6_9BACT|nr:Uncharacterized protein dnm_080500 [Desulfonema magnum]
MRKWSEAEFSQKVSHPLRKIAKIPLRSISARPFVRKTFRFTEYCTPL